MPHLRLKEMPLVQLKDMAQTGELSDLLAQRDQLTELTDELRRRGVLTDANEEQLVEGQRMTSSLLVRRSRLIKELLRRQQGSDRGLCTEAPLVETPRSAHTEVRRRAAPKKVSGDKAPPGLAPGFRLVPPSAVTGPSAPHQVA